MCNHLQSAAVLLLLSTTACSAEVVYDPTGSTTTTGGATSSGSGSGSHGSGGNTAVDVTEGYALRISADDRWQVYLDGKRQEPRTVNAESWGRTDDVPLDLTPGEHVIAVRAWDELGVVNGLIAALILDGEPLAVTGDGSWHAVNGNPYGFQNPEYDDTGWTELTPCWMGTVDHYWGNTPGKVRDLGAVWAWTGNCDTTGEIAVRLHVDVP